MPKFGSQIDTMGIPTKGLTAEQGTAFPTDPWEGRFFQRTDQKAFYVYLNGGWQRSDNQGVAAASHLHAIADVTGLQAALDGKAAASHTHTTAQVTGLDTALAGKAAVSHAHAISDVSGLQAALDGKATPAQATAAANAAVQAVIAGAPGALDTLDELAAALGDDPNFRTTILNAIAGKADSVHAHTIAQITGLQAALDATSRTVTIQSPAFVAGVGKQIDVSPAQYPKNVTFFLNDSGQQGNPPYEPIVLDWNRAPLFVGAQYIAVTSHVAFAAGALTLVVSY